MSDKREYYINKHGIRIAKICASCVHHGRDRENSPTCDLVQKEPWQRLRTCSRWTMQPMYERIGGNSTDGEIKVGYIQFVCGWRAAEALHKVGAAPQGAIDEQYRKRYESTDKENL